MTRSPLDPEIEALQIVLIGSFNPQIFQPAWFASQGLLSATEAEHASLKLIHPEIAAFETDRLQIEVRKNRFIGSCADPKAHEQLHDVVFGAFRTLHHTPIGVAGINLNSHFALGSREACDKLGFTLVPQEPWNDTGLDTRMKDLAITAPRPDDTDGYIQIRVQPSNRVPLGVFIEVNDHFELSKDQPVDALRILPIVEAAWGDSIRRSRTLTQKVLANR